MTFIPYKLLKPWRDNGHAQAHPPSPCIYLAGQPYEYQEECIVYHWLKAVSNSAHLPLNLKLCKNMKFLVRWGMTHGSITPSSGMLLQQLWKIIDKASDRGYMVCTLQERHDTRSMHVLRHIRSPFHCSHSSPRPGLPCDHCSG